MSDEFAYKLILFFYKYFPFELSWFEFYPSLKARLMNKIQRIWKKILNKY